MKIIRGVLGIIVGELVGTFLLVFLCICIEAVRKFERDTEIFTIVGKGIAMTFALLASISLSGGHLNPAVSVGFTIAGKCNLFCLPFYFIAQLLGGFLASPVVFMLYTRPLKNRFMGLKLERMPYNSKEVFVRMPRPDVTSITAIIDNILASFVFVLMSIIIRQKKIFPMQRYTVCLFTGIVYMALGFSLRYNNNGNPVNLAADFPVRIFLTTYGYLGILNDPHGYWISVVLIGSLIGAVFAGIIGFACFDWQFDDGGRIPYYAGPRCHIPTIDATFIRKLFKLKKKEEPVSVVASDIKSIPTERTLFEDGAGPTSDYSMSGRDKDADRHRTSEDSSFGPYGIGSFSTGLFEQGPEFRDYKPAYDTFRRYYPTASPRRF